MYQKGHSGLTLFIMSVLFWFLPFSTNSLTMIVLAGGLSALPDYDLIWQRQGLPIKHRGITHSILFAIFAGVAFAVMFWYANRTLLWAWMGFVSGFMAVVSHMIGDTFTHHPFKALYPFSQKEYGAFHWTSANNKAANEGLMTLGSTTFVLYLMKGTGVLKDLLNLL